jgi:chemotaxis receptor (MCP) glutamine deamidase CheD
VVERPEVTIHIGQAYATQQPTILKTIVGSGVVVCVFDPDSRVGGMNHFMLPTGNGATDGTRLGMDAMELLLAALQKAGGDTSRLQARLLGGGHVVRGPGDGDDLLHWNAEFIERYMATERIAVVSRDLGGYLPRRVRFQTDTGKAYVKRLGPHMLRQTRAEEREHLLALAQQQARAGSVASLGS